MRDGSLVFTDVGGKLVNNVTKLKYTHVLIWLRGLYYEATPPRVRKTSKVENLGPAPIKLLDVVEPDPQYTDDQIERMFRFAERNLGRRYVLMGYFFPKLYGRTRGVYCSEFACDVLLAGGVDISKRSGYTPDLLYEAVTGRKP